MATAKRQPDAAVTDTANLLRCSRGEFHAVLRVLERELTRATPGTTRLGLDGPASREPVRLRANPTLAFPAAEVTRIEPLGNRPEQGYQVRANVMGLTGPAGALPNHYTNAVARGERRKDHALGDFLNLFDHRLLSLLHRAWAKYKPTIQLEEAHPSARTDAFTRTVDALSGQRPGRSEDDHRYYAGHFARATRSAAGLATLLRDFLGHPVRVESLVGQWLLLEQQDRARVGSGGRGANNRLGAGVLTGRRVWNVDSRVTVHIGPLRHAAHRQLMPGTERYRRMRQLIADYVPPSLTVDLRFHLSDSDEQPSPLGNAFQLGRNAWLRGRNRRLRPAAMRLGGST